MRDHTHVLPFFLIRHADGREQAVCGQFVTARQLAPAETLPTCAGCRMWVENIDVIAPMRVEPENRSAS